MPSINRSKPKQNQSSQPLSDNDMPTESVSIRTPQQKPLPTKTPITPETQRIREQYPDIEFLEAGNIASWLQERSDQLLNKAEFERNSIDILKLFNGLIVAGGLGFITANPIVPIGATIAALGFSYSVIEDLISTHKFRPLPFVRDGLLDWFTRMGNADARANYEEIEYLSLIQYLPPFERSEIDMLSTSMDYLTFILSKLPVGKRFYAYRYLLRRYILTRGELPGMQDVAQHIQHVNIDTNINTEAIAQYQKITNTTEYRAVTATNQPRLAQSVSIRTVNDMSEEYEDDIQDSDSVSIRTPDNAPTQNQTNVTKSNNFIEPRYAESTDNSYFEDDIDTDSYSGLDALQFQQQEKNVSIRTPKTPKKILRDFRQIKALPVGQRANACIDLLIDEGFRIDKICNSQIMAVCSSQRGGKSSLMNLAAILMMGEKPTTKLYYFSTGRDIYPVKTTKHISALNYDDDDDNANLKASKKIYKFFRDLDNSSSVGKLKDVVIMVDEVAGILKCLDTSEVVWLLEYWLRAFAKTGATLYLGLHATNLMALSGKNTGWAQQFKTGVSWIGCKTEVIETESRLRPLLRASGDYFITDPEDFGKVVEPLGCTPDWLKVAKNPFTEQPDPVRSMLALFPEFYMPLEEIANLENQRSQKKLFDFYSTDQVQKDCADAHRNTDGNDENEIEKLAEKLYTWLDAQLDKGHEHIFTKREIQRYSPIREPKNFERVILYFIEMEWFIDLGEGTYRYTID